MDENDSGWRVIRLSSFTVKTLNKLRTNIIGRLRQFVLGAGDTDKKKKERERGRRRRLIMTSDGKRKERERKRKRRLTITNEEKLLLNEKKRIYRKTKKIDRPLKIAKPKKPKSPAIIKKLKEYRQNKKSMREKERVNVIPWYGEWCRPHELNSWNKDSPKCLDGILTYNQKAHMLLDYSKVMPPGNCLYSTIVICLLIRKWNVTNVKDWNDLFFEKNSADFFSDEEILDQLKEDNQEWSEWERSLSKLKEDTRNLNYEGLLYQCEKFVTGKFYENVNAKIYTPYKKVVKSYVMHKLLKTRLVPKCVETMRVVYESRNITKEEQNPLNDFKDEKEMNLANERKKLRNTLKIFLIKNENDSNFHCMSMLNVDYSVLKECVDGFNRQYSHCPHCSQIYTSPNYEHNCRGYFEHNLFQYGECRQFYEPQKKLLKASRNIFPFFITFDCETDVSSIAPDNNKKSYNILELKYFCQSIVVNCINKKLASEIFGTEKNGEVITQIMNYYENTVLSLKDDPLSRLTCDIKDAANIINSVQREILWTELNDMDGVLELIEGEKKKMELRVFDLLFLADTLVRFSYEKLLEKNKVLTITSIEKKNLWNTKEVLCTICRMECDRIKKNVLYEMPIQFLINRNHNNVLVYEWKRVNVANYVFSLVSKVELSLLPDNCKTYLIQNTGESVKRDLLHITTLFYVTCRWWYLIENSKEMRWYNGLLCEYVMFSSEDLLTCMRDVFKIVLTEVEMNFYYDRDDLYELHQEDKFFFMKLMSIFIKRLKERARMEIGRFDKIMLLHYISQELKHPIARIWLESILLCVKKRMDKMRHYYNC
ncbi:TPA_asm: hypothetical protein [Hydra MELD virus]|nr:TPA_asm: hypothetical protein [Hydra MELD virus]